MALLRGSNTRGLAWNPARWRPAWGWARLVGAGTDRLTAAHLLVLGLIVLAPVGVLSAARGFDGLYGQDAFAYFDYAVGPLRGAVLAGQFVPPPAFFWPPGYPVLVALVALATGPQAVAGQLVSLLMGACVPVATAQIARELWPNSGRRALLAGGLCGACGQLWQSSAVVMSDTTGLALATLGVWAVLRYERRPGATWLILAAALLGWATITRWIYGLVALVAAAYAVWVLTRVAPRRVVTHGAPAALVGALVLAWVLVPAMTQTPSGPFLGTLETYGSETWSLANLVQREFLTTGHGYVRYSLPNGVYYAAAPLHPYMLTPLLGLLAMPGLLVLVRQHAWRPGALLIGWAVAMYLFHAGSTWQNLRYVLAYLPPLAILAGVGADALLDYARRPVGVWLLGGLCWAAAGGLILTNQFVDRKQADLAMVRWVDAQLPPQAELVTFGPTLTFRHYSHRSTLELFELSPGDLPALVADGRAQYLLLDVANVEQQWVGRAPAEDYQWLRDGPGLMPLGTAPGERLTLFRVGRT